MILAGTIVLGLALVALYGVILAETRGLPEDSEFRSETDDR
jgi:hypothetical protein